MKNLGLSMVLLLAACTSLPRPTPSPVPSEPSKAEPARPSPSPGRTAIPTTQPGLAVPYPGAPLCGDSGESHDNSLFHTLWDSARGCHYDHEHGQNPFTPEVAAAFPGFDLYALLGNVGVGHTNPSSPMENTHKHTGFKWDVTLSHSAGCGTGAVSGVDAFVIQYHNFGNYAVEFESRVHSAVGLLRQCLPSTPTDYGYVFVNQHQDYGQRVAPYQGLVLPYPDTPRPAFDSGISPYFSVACFGSLAPCDKYPSRDYALSHNANTDTTWVSRPQAASIGSPLLALLFRARDTFQILDFSDQAHPFTFLWMCSADGGQTYSATPACRYNNTTTRVHELHGEIPAEWDNLEDLDTDPRVGRVTAEAFVTAFGDLNLACSAPGPNCHPIKLVQAFTGPYGSTLALGDGKAGFDPLNLPERDFYFCGGQPCAEGDPGAVSSGWIGPDN